MADLSGYPSISDADALHRWIAEFRGKTGWVRSSKAKRDAAEKRPIAESLQSIAALNTRRGSPATLELNALYACYMATRAPAPEHDVNSETRRSLAEELKQRPKALRALNDLQNYLAEHKDIALRAIAQSDRQDKKPVQSPTTQSAQRLETLTNMLADFEYGLMEFNADRDHIALISGSDFHYGPFEFDFDLNISWKSKGTSSDDIGMNFIQTGLMFHLTYLFRYFTCDELPRTAAFFRNDILVLDGVRMLDVGDPHGAYVAALSNAVFAEKFSSRDVKDRLRSLRNAGAAADDVRPTAVQPGALPIGLGPGDQRPRQGISTFLDDAGRRHRQGRRAGAGSSVDGHRQDQRPCTGPAADGDLQPP